MVDKLVKAEAIETGAPREVQSDIESVLQQYIKDEQDISDRARDIVNARNLPQSELSRTRRALAEDRKMKVGDEAIDYLLDQLVEILLHSANVEEVFVEDVELRRLMRDPLRKQASEEDKLDTQVRDRLKHVKEGTSLWEVEYRRMMEDVRRRKGL
jgi:hypothetical protein